MFFHHVINESISLELLQHDQFQEIYTLIDENREHLREWLLWVDKRKTPEDMKPVIKYWLENFSNNKGFDLGIRYKSFLVGMVGVEFDWGNNSAHIGYFLSKEHEGKGIITTSLKHLTTEIFQRYNINRIEIQCASNNTKSQGIPKRLGFKNEGVKRQAQRLYNHYEDLIVFSLLSDDL